MAPPIHKIQKHGLAVAVWGDANNPRLSIDKRYKDKQTNEWKSSNYLFENEVVTLNELLQEALGWIAQNKTGADVREVLGAKVVVKPANDDDDWDSLPF